MKETLTTSEVTDRLMADKNAGWIYGAARALAEYFEGYENDTGEEMELDVVAIRCDFGEYESAKDAYKQQTGDDIDGEDEDEKEENALKYLEDNTTIIKFDDGIVMQNY